MNARTYFRWMLRDARGARGRMVFFMLCLSAGVAAIVGTSALAAGVSQGLVSQSREMLGADFTVDARRPLPTALDEALAARPELERSDTIETVSMVGAAAEDGASRLAEVFGVRGRYPLYGEVPTRPAGGLSAHLAPDAVVLDGDLSEALSVDVGDQVRVGEATLRVAAIASGGPQRTGFTAMLAPRIYVHHDSFPKTGLLGFGARVRYRALLGMDGQLDRRRLRAYVDAIEAEVPGAEHLDYDTHYQSMQGRRWVERTEGFVGLVALLALIIGGIGVATVVRTWITGRARSIAVMRCIGCTPAQILVLFLGHTALLALLGSLAGAAAGAALPYLAQSWASNLLPTNLVIVFPLGAILRGVGLGVGLALAFALPVLASIWRVTPARVLRADADPLPPHRLVATLSMIGLIGAIFLAAAVQAHELSHALWFTGGFLGLALILRLAAGGLRAVAARVPREGLSPYLAHGIRALARPGAGTTSAVIALGLGAMVVTAVAVIELGLRDALLARVPKQAPSMYLLDVRPEQRTPVRELLSRNGATEEDAVPIVVGRIAAIDDVPLADLLAEPRRGRSEWGLSREQRLTWREKLPPDNVITEGALWSDPDVLEASLETRHARRIGVKLGSRITFDVQGIPVTVTVTSLRDVEWESLSLNFRTVLEPGTLEGAPALYLMSARIANEQEMALQAELVRAFSNVSVLRVRALLDQIMALLERIALGMRLLAALTILAGLATLAGAIASTVIGRRREVALLKTLGVTRRGAAALLAVEYALCGALAGLMGAGGALLLAYGWLTWIAEVDVALPWIVLPLAMLGMAILGAICGVLVNARALRVRPSVVLR